MKWVIVAARMAYEADKREICTLGKKEGKIYIDELKADLIKDRYPRGARHMVRRMRHYVSEATKKSS